MQDCLIVGGGLIGMLTARELARAGLSVTVVERGQVGQESTWAGGGIISPLYPWRYSDAVTRLASWSQLHYEQLATELLEESGEDPQWTQNGLLILDSNEESAATPWGDRFERRLELVSPEAVQQLEPQLNPDIATNGIWLPEVAQVRNPRLVHAMRGSLRHYGVNLLQETAVDELLIRDGRIGGVMAGGQALKSDKVVIASGAWSARLLKQTGVELPVEPVRGQMLLYKTLPGLVSRIVLSKDRYVIPRRDGRVLVGSTLEYTGFEKITTEEARQELEQEACRLIPALADYPVEHHWAGLRPGSPQGIPYIYESGQIAGLYVNAGHFRNGVVLGPASARLMSDLILKKVPILDSNPYNLCV